MSGHSKWSTIKRKKAAVDAKRGKVFTRLLREVTVAARLGGGDVDGNPRLRSAVQDARGSNVPSEKVERAIKKGCGELGDVVLDEVVYEGYGPGGVAVLVETMTDNKNRTVSEVRHLFAKSGGNLGETGCVGYLFEQKGLFTVAMGTADEDELFEQIMDLDIEDVSSTNNLFEITTEASAYSRVRDQLTSRGCVVEHAQLALVPLSSVEVAAKKLPQVLRLLEGLEELDDVQNVWTNFEADEDALAALV